MTQYVYEFAEGNKDQRDLLGGKGANLAEMTRLGLPVPPGFTITTEACRSYLAAGHEPPELRVNVTAALRRLEDRLDRRPSSTSGSTTPRYSASLRHRGTSGSRGTPTDG